MQKAVVVLTEQPFVKLCKQIAALVGPLFFESGPVVFEAALDEISDWLVPFSASAALLTLVLQARTCPRSGRAAAVSGSCTSISGPIFRV